MSDYHLIHFLFFYILLSDFSVDSADGNATQHQRFTIDPVTIDQQSSMIDVVHLNQAREEPENHLDNSEVDITTVDQLETNVPSTITHSTYRSIVL